MFDRRSIDGVTEEIKTNTFSKYDYNLFSLSQNLIRAVFEYFNRATYKGSRVFQSTYVAVKNYFREGSEEDIVKMEQELKSNSENDAVHLVGKHLGNYVSKYVAIYLDDNIRKFEIHRNFSSFISKEFMLAISDYISSLEKEGEPMFKNSKKAIRNYFGGVPWSLLEGGDIEYGDASQEEKPAVVRRYVGVFLDTLKFLEGLETNSGSFDSLDTIVSSPDSDKNKLN